MKSLKIAVIGVASLTLVACGGSNESNDTVSNNQAVEQTESSSLPPDPGEQGKTTLAGIDSDNDGVRDDVQIAINQRYGTDEVKVKALEQSAKALQSAITSDTASNIEASSLVLTAVDCLHATMEDPSAEISFIENAVVNTAQRSEAYVSFNSALDGQFFGDNNSTNPCQ